jgi:hypothetical protein
MASGADPAGGAGEGRPFAAAQAARLLASWAERHGPRLAS